MKLRLIRNIVQNVRWIFSFGFWRGAYYGELRPVWSLILLVLFTACADILRMIFRPGYPNKTARQPSYSLQPTSVGLGFLFFKTKFFLSDLKTISPLLQVSYVRTLSRFKVSKVSLCGWPYELSLPDEIIAHSGLTAVTYFSLVLVREP